MLSRYNSNGSLDETKGLLSEDEHKPGDGHLELHMSSGSSNGSKGVHVESTPKTDDKKFDKKDF